MLNSACTPHPHETSKTRILGADGTYLRLAYTGIRYYTGIYYYTHYTGIIAHYTPILGYIYPIYPIFILFLYRYYTLYTGIKVALYPSGPALVTAHMAW